MIKRKYDDEFKKRLVKLHVEDGRSMESIKKEYNLSHGILNKWVKNYREEGIDNMEEKFHKLEIFYAEGLSYTGWDKYETIKLDYKGQIVCEKKINYEQE